MTTPQGRARAGLIVDKLARKLVQVGFLLLFLYPLVPVILRRETSRARPTITSWLLPWDPLVLLGKLAQRDTAGLAIGSAALIIALTLLLGRVFCGWVCPVGTLLDLLRPLAFWQRGKKNRGDGLFPNERGGPVKYYLLVAVLGGAALSVHLLGVLDPLVVFQRATTGLVDNAYDLAQPTLRMHLGIVSLVFTAMLLLELVQPRFWCRHLCPLGALLGCTARFSLLNRKVTPACDGCADCRHVCPMSAIPRQPHETAYADCTFCLDCRSACPKDAHVFSFGLLAGKRWKKTALRALPDGTRRLEGRWEEPSAPVLGRRQLLGGIAAGSAGLAVAPLDRLVVGGKVIRPPGALPEDEFLRRCIICQECIRVCPTRALRPTFLESGLAGMGTPKLVARLGGCALNPSCDDLCARACPVGALKPIDRTREKWQIGVAKVDRTLCLAWDQGAKCLVCAEACVEDAALFYNGRVVVVADKCTGCGRCEHACPVVGSAIRVGPRA